MNKNKDNQRLRRYWDNLYTKEDASELFKMFKEEDAFDSSQMDDRSLWEEALASASPLSAAEKEQCRKEARNLLNRLKKESRKEVRKKLFLPRIAWQAVAVVCLLVGSGLLWNYWRESLVEYVEVATSINERRDITLPDGTHLTLNACSRVRYPEQFLSDARELELEGEGFFDVAHDEKHPFRVKTGRMDVRVLGTRFNVKSYITDEVVSVEVEEGKVQVVLPEASMLLRADDQMVFNTSSGTFQKQHTEREVAVWRKGALRFDNMPVRDVAKMLERMYDCHIHFEPGQEFENLISGEHDNISLESVLQSIEYASGIHYRKEGKNIFLYKNGDK